MDPRKYDVWAAVLASIEKLVRAQSPIDMFGVGTKMGVSADAPCFDIAYKLTEYAGRGRMKLSARKSTMPGRKQVWRNSRVSLPGSYDLKRCRQYGTASSSPTGAGP